MKKKVRTGMILALLLIGISIRSFNEVPIASLEDTTISYSFGRFIKYAFSLNDSPAYGHPPYYPQNFFSMSTCNITFSPPDADGVMNLTIPMESCNSEPAYDPVGYYTSQWALVSDGYGKLYTIDGVGDVDIKSMTNDTGMFFWKDGSWHSAGEEWIGDGTPDPAGSSWLFMCWNVSVYDGEGTSGLPLIVLQLDLWLTTGYSENTVVEPASRLDGFRMSEKGVPFSDIYGNVTYVTAWARLNIGEESNPLDLHHKEVSRSNYAIPEKNLDGTQWWKNLVNIAMGYPIESYPEDIPTFVDEFRIEIMDSTIQAWEYLSSMRAWPQCKEFANHAHSSNIYVGGCSGFIVGSDFPELYDESLSEEERWYYPNGTVAFDPYLVGASRTFSGYLALSHICYPEIPALSHHNPGWSQFLQEWVKNSIRVGMDAVHLDCPYNTFSLFVTGGFGGKDTWDGFRFNEHLKNKFANDELAQMGIEDPDGFDFVQYLTSNFEIDGINEDYEVTDGYRIGTTTVEFSDVSRVMRDPIVKEWLIFQYQSYLQFAGGLYESSKNYASSLNRTVLLHTNQYEEVGFAGNSIGPLQILLSQIFDVVNIEANTLFLPPYVRSTVIYKVGAASGHFNKPVWVYESFGWFSGPYSDGNLIGDVSTILKIKCAEGLASGGIWKIPFATGDPIDGWPPRRLVEGDERQEISKYSQFTYEKRNYFQGVIPRSRVAIIYSIPTMLWDYVPAFNLFPNEHKGELAGWAAVLQENHIDYDIHIFGHPLLFNDTFVDRIQNYDLLILPDVICLSDNHLNVLSKYLEDGGHLVITGQFGSKDENSNIRSVSPTDSFSQHENVSYIPGPIGYNYESALESQYFDSPSYQTMTDTIMGHLQARDYLQTNASRKIGVSSFTQSNDSRIVLHLVNYDYHYNQERDWVAEADNIYMKVPLSPDFKLGAVKLFSPDFPEEIALDFNRTEEFVEFTVPRLEVWDVISLEPLRGDVNNDGDVDIYDVVTVSIAFGSKLGDSNWNPIADVAEPYGEIDIFDVVTVTMNFGKTA